MGVKRQILEPDLSRLRNLLSEGFQGCPYESSESERICPLHELRKRDFWERMEFFSALNNDALKYLNDYCEVCHSCKAVLSKPPPSAKAKPSANSRPRRKSKPGRRQP